MNRERLSWEDVQAALKGLPGWAYEDDRLRRTVTTASFPAAIRLVQRVADVAEDLDHHPDIDIRYQDVTFTCWTHTTGGVTGADVELARRIDALATLG
jgi:4a-hydroxytetrahydrobiopterin dehydratase